MNNQIINKCKSDQEFNKRADKFFELHAPLTVVSLMKRISIKTLDLVKVFYS